jgi:hypothetical protein
MKINLQENSHANISFTTNAKVSVRGEHRYNVKWFRDKEFIGNMDLGGGNWGAFPNEIGNWEIEFWQDGDLIQSIDFNLEGRNVLVFPIFLQNMIGKNTNLIPLQEYIQYIEEKYKCNTYVCFIHSEYFNTGFRTLKMNDELDFSIIIEKQF